MNEVNLSGAVQGEPELKFTANGSAVCNFCVRVTGAAREGKERPTSFFDCVIWGKPAEHLAETFRGGDRIIVSGKLEQQRWESSDGAKRSKIVVVAWTVGVDLSYVTAEVNRVERDGERADSELASFPG